MKTVFTLMFVVLAFAIGNARAYSDYLYVDQPLVQARFNELIPTSYPTIKPDFNKLQPTTWPLICPGAPQIHITEGLVHPTELALLLSY